MCGINGIHAYSPQAPPVDADELVTTRDAMRARGPDDEGSWIHDGGRVGLGHRRLSIIDLSPRGAQPMRTPDGARVVVYNGEIYNYRALRSELEGRFDFQSDSDTEVLLHLYEDRGEAMFEALRGMYAFAIWDEPRQRLVLARDPYGIKPLYIADDGHCLRFASQVKALLAGRASRTPDLAGVAGFYLFGSVPEPHTLFQSIRSLPAGCHQIWTADGPGPVKRHASLAQIWARAVSQPRPTTPDERASLVAEAVRDSVAHHLVADVPVGAFLSAGIDSTTLVAVMADMEQAPVKTLTMAFDEFRGSPRDEAPLAEQVARRYGADHHERVFTQREFVESVPAILDDMDQPSIDGINTWMVSRATAELGLKVAVSGLGGDELFGGYPNTFGAIPRMVDLLRVPSRVPMVAKAFRRLCTSRLLRDRLNPKIASTLELGGSYEGAYLLRRGAFMPWELPTVMSEDAAAEGLSRLAPLQLIADSIHPDPRQPFARIAALEASLYMRNQLLRDSDWASMAHSLELRVPLVDITLLETLAPILTGLTGPIDKQWLASAARPPLPAAILEKPKTGFGIPIAEWIVGANHPDLDTWRRVPSLQRENCPWARRLAHALVQRALAG